MANYITLKTDDISKERLDVFLFRELQKQFPHLKVTRSFLSNNVSNIVKVNGEVKKKGFTIKSGDIVELDIEKLEAIVARDNNTEIIPQEGQLNIVFESDHFLVINKPQGLVVHLGDNNREHTLVNYLRYYFEAKGIDCKPLERCGLVHRLDKGVSGLMIIAKDKDTQLYLKAQFEKHAVIKVYKAKVVGDVEQAKSKLDNFAISEKTAKEELDAFIKEGFKLDTSWSRVEGYIKRDKANRKRMRFSLDKEDNTGKHALSFMKFLKNNEVLIKIETGRMHQIRATLKFLGLIIQDDTLYSSGTKNSDFISLQSVLLGVKIDDDHFMHWRLI